jgi:hypothetical protein
MTRTYGHPGKCQVYFPDGWAGHERRICMRYFGFLSDPQTGPVYPVNVTMNVTISAPTRAAFARGDRSPARGSGRSSDGHQDARTQRMEVYREGRRDQLGLFNRLKSGTRSATWTLAPESRMSCSRKGSLACDPLLGAARRQRPPGLEHLALISVLSPRGVRIGIRGRGLPAGQYLDKLGDTAAHSLGFGLEVAESNDQST